MKTNLGKFQYILVGKHKPLIIWIEGFQPESAKSVNLLGITIDHNLTFDTHASNICKTASANVKSLAELEMPWIKNKQNYSITLLFCHWLITVL